MKHLAKPAAILITSLTLLVSVLSSSFLKSSFAGDERCVGQIELLSEDCGSALIIENKMISRCLKNTSPAFSSLIKACKENLKRQGKLSKGADKIIAASQDCEGPIRSTVNVEYKGESRLQLFVGTSMYPEIGYHYLVALGKNDPIETEIRTYCQTVFAGGPASAPAGSTGTGGTVKSKADSAATK